MAWWRRGGSDPAPPRGGPDVPPPAPAPVQRAAWEDLPPLRPVLTATPPVAPLDTFTNSLATARNPSFLAPLGHQVDPAGPSGHVSGLASPVAPQAISSGPELPVAARPVESRRSSLASVVQRALAPRMWLSDSVASSASTDQATSPALPTATPSPADSPTVDQGGDFSPLPGPRHLEPAAPPAPFSLTSAPDPGEFSILPVVSSPTRPAASSCWFGGSDGFPARIRGRARTFGSRSTPPARPITKRLASRCPTPCRRVSFNAALAPMRRQPFRRRALRPISDCRLPRCSATPRPMARQLAAPR